MSWKEGNGRPGNNKNDGQKNEVEAGQEKKLTKGTAEWIRKTSVVEKLNAAKEQEARSGMSTNSTKHSATLWWQLDPLLVHMAFLFRTNVLINWPKFKNASFLKSPTLTVKQ